MMTPIETGPSTNAKALTRRELLGAGAAIASGAAHIKIRQAALPISRPVFAKRVILLWMDGGLSHLDTFDPKPLAPPAIRGPFGEIATNADGIRISDRLPRLAQHADKFALLRGISHGEGGHERAASYIKTGFAPASPAAPDFGSILTRYAAKNHAALNWQKTARTPAEQRIENLYGESKFGRDCLAARRLAEAGSPFVSVTLPGFDTHTDHFPRLQNGLLPILDRAFSALIVDLRERGLLESTLVICMGEFGRSPRINFNRLPGRDHWPNAMCAVLAGGGITGGRICGATDAQGMAPAEFAIRPEDIITTVYHLAGITEPERKPSGRVLYEICV